jgi:hypothetical protein
MNIHEEYEFRKAYIQEHHPRMSPADLATAVMQQDRDFYHRWRHYQSYKSDPGPTLVHKQADRSYEGILTQVTEAAQTAGVSRDTAFVTLLKSAEGTPDFPALHAAYRTFHLTDGIKDRDAAALAKAESPIVSTAAALSDPRGVVAYVEDLVRTLALTMGVSDDAVMQRLKAKQPGLHGLYVQAKQTVPALPPGAPTSPDSVKMVRR